MGALNSSQIRAIEEAMAYPRGFGYVLDFSDRSMEQFFYSEFGIAIYDDQYRVNGSSKRNCLSTFLGLTDSYTALRVLRSLWDRREGLLNGGSQNQLTQDARSKTARFREVIESLEGEPSVIQPDGIDKFSAERTLEELVADIERTLAANKPEYRSPPHVLRKEIHTSIEGSRN